MTMLKTLGAARAGAVLSILAAGAIPAGATDVRQVVEIKAPPAAVWAKVGGWCAIKDWHPAIAACDDSHKRFRTLTLKDGGKIVEKMTKTGKLSYSYGIVDGPLPVKNYTATLVAKPDSLGSTDLTWTATFDPKGKTDSEAAAVINGIFDAGLKNIKSSMTFAATDAVPAAPAAAAPAPAGDAKAMAAEARKKKIEAAKLEVLEKAAEIKAEFAKLRAELAEKAKVAAENAKIAFEKAKAAYAAATAPAPVAPAPAPSKP